MASKLYFSFDLKQTGEKIVCYYPNMPKFRKLVKY